MNSYFLDPKTVSHPKRSAVYYWIRHEDGFFGPYPSRRKAGRARYVAINSYRRPNSKPQARWKRSDIVSATPTQVMGWEECMSADRQMLANAY